jgi:protein-S-isoprenylcysteine O-methyltransferase Ste14
MIEVAVVGWFVYVLVAFGLRTLVHLWQTGSTGFVGVSREASWRERIAVVAMVGAFALALVAPWVGRPLDIPTWPGVLTLVLATLGTLVAQLAMSRSWRIGVDASERTALVTRFPFTLVRNPIFTCMIAALLGIALCCPTPVSFVSPLLLLAALSVQVRLVEEPYLLASHGTSYRDYAARTGRFVPGVGRLA